MRRRIPLRPDRVPFRPASHPSQPSPASFIELFEEAADAGDEVIVITVAQKLSGTYQCASLAAADLLGIEEKSFSV